ncbi:SigE family RNA polymerase sigma factor [Actinobacteria bacterium YIM 96077]|uniref:SigE family RNA polymerase sigma factor n=1 Tax=Phytoactinopolyspora halophila TaxID=1981511 RepID=A0A329R102_9ACTN|nr:SigE family RNA polymerase sigma factor [Phytoactinopolyspora halophila]AYY13140.1 SigE family RNA polymerase sigma factor [Actinobacteria bacterium YIM 96077]RAW17619.1 SigE family RNA polymerase sigma factor [Phytoactinopolyspora halophila]
MSSGTEGFGDFAAACSGPLFRTAWLLTGDWHLAEDLVQETLGKVFRRWGRLDQIEEPIAYARTVLMRTYLSHRRRRSSGEQPAETVPESATYDGDVALRLTLLDGLAELDAKDRAVLVSRYWEDRSVEETAAELDLSPGAVKSRSFRALQRLRAALGDSGVGDMSALHRSA